MSRRQMGQSADQTATITQRPTPTYSRILCGLPSRSESIKLGAAASAGARNIKPSAIAVERASSVIRRCRRKMGPIYFLMEYIVAEKFRIEKDTLGELAVPADAWYGVQTARAVANFPISGRGPDTDFIIAHARVKYAAAVANRDAGWLDSRLAAAVIEAAEKIVAGECHDQFVVDRFQAGAGTSHN